MLTAFRAFGFSITPSVREDEDSRSRLEKYTGCDGRRHVTWPIKIFLADTGTVVFAESQPLQNVEPCDGSCLNRPTVAEFMAEAH